MWVESYFGNWFLFHLKRRSASWVGATFCVLLSIQKEAFGVRYSAERDRAGVPATTIYSVNVPSSSREYNR